MGKPGIRSAGNRVEGTNFKNPLSQNSLDHSLLFSPFFFLFRAHADSEILQSGGLVRAGLNIGESIAIVGGGGGLGHLGVQFAKALGLFVIAIDARDEGLQLAKGCGAGTVVDARQRRKRPWRKLRR